MGNAFSYYSRTISSGCVLTAAMVGLVYTGSLKPLAFPFLLLYSIVTAVVASFLAALLVRRTMAHLDSRRLWIWLTVGGGVELALVLAVGFLARYFSYMAGESSSWMQYMRLFFFGQIALFPKWWLAVPIGVAIGAMGYTVDARQQ